MKSVRKGRCDKVTEKRGIDSGKIKIEAKLKK
jgi:hypothetical protein